MDKKFFVLLPKLELHAHLNGSLSENTLRELQTSEENVNDFLKLNHVLDLGPARTLEECFEIFKIAHNATNTPENIRIATSNVIKEFYDDGVIYLELRTTPRQTENMSKHQYIDAVIQGINHSKIDIPNMKVKLILSLDRKQPITEAEENAELAILYKEKHPDIIAGIDVSGDPTKNSWFENILKKIKLETDLKITIHCAEIKNEAEVLEILKFKPNRIGHGICIHPDTGGSEELWKELRDRRIPIECCLTSNIKTKSTIDHKNHHFKYLFSSRHPVSLCTDDKGVFATSLSQEFQIAAESFKLSKTDLWKISYDSIEYSFCTEEEKQELRDYLKQWYAENINKETTV